MTGQESVDLVVIGGGINGAGIARDAAGRGLSVILSEKDDLAQGTSSRPDTRTRAPVAAPSTPRSARDRAAPPVRRSSDGSGPIAA